MSAVAVALPQAHEPPEERGLARDDVRLMVATRHDGSIVHARFRDVGTFLAPGDLLVVNTSATIPAALTTRREDGTVLALHLSTPAPGLDGAWVVELRRGAAPFRGAQIGEELSLPESGRAEIVAPYVAGTRLWLASLDLPEPLEAYLRRHGRPIRYGYVRRDWPLSAYQTVYALEAGSAEMASAGRPFTTRLITKLMAGGIQLAPVVLHAGVSSPERNEPPYSERYRVPEETARLVNAAHRSRGRVVAVGTTVVRALETAAAPGGSVVPGEGWTNLVVTPERGLWVVDGLITGWHEPEASHHDLLRAAAPEDLLERCYAAALAHGYLWHEFGDSHLILP